MTVAQSIAGLGLHPTPVVLLLAYVYVRSSFKKQSVSLSVGQSV